LAGLRARAEAQHNWVLQGDERGLYSEYPPAAIWFAPDHTIILPLNERFVTLFLTVF
jgi:hypothetical protein